MTRCRVFDRRPNLRLILAAVSTVSTSLAAPEPRPSPAPVTPLAEVPFTLHRNAVILEATVNGREPIRLLLDTGWGPLALVSTAARRLGLQSNGSAGGFPRVDVASLAVGGAVKRDVFFEVFPVEELEPLIGPHDGVLSTTFLRFHAVSPIPERPPPEPGTRARVPMMFSPRAGALPFTDSVLVDGEPVRALFDTGGAAASWRCSNLWIVRGSRFYRRQAPRP